MDNRQRKTPMFPFDNKVEMEPAENASRLLNKVELKSTYGNFEDVNGNAETISRRLYIDAKRESLDWEGQFNQSYEVKVVDKRDQGGWENFEIEIESPTTTLTFWSVGETEKSDKRDQDGTRSQFFYLNGNEEAGERLQFHAFTSKHDTPHEVTNINYNNIKGGSVVIDLPKTRGNKLFSHIVTFLFNCLERPDEYFGPTGGE